jgi:hypothetical protein
MSRHAVLITACALAALAGDASLLAQGAAKPPVNLGSLTITGPTTLRDLGGAGVRGVATRLAWSPDGEWLYLRVSKFDRWSNETVRHVLAEVRGSRVQDLGDEPAWLPRYWNVKSALTSPVVATWRIKIDTREDQVRTTNVPREGNIGQHGDPGAGMDETVRKAALASQKALFEDFVLNGHVIASAINDHVMPGRMFAWAPPPLAVMAFVDAKGKLRLMNQAGATREVKGARKPSIPAWSEDGHRLAYAQGSSSSSDVVIKVVEIR